jgi:hypothetical protein
MTVRSTGSIRKGLRSALCAVVIAAAGCISASASLGAVRTPRLLLFSALVGSPAHIVHRLNHFAVNHYSVSHAHWSVWNSRHAAASASVLEEFPGATPKRIRATVKLTRPAYRCGIYTYTRLLVNGQVVSALDAYSGICNWVVQ